MSKKIVTIMIILAALAAGAWAIFGNSDRDVEQTYNFASVSIGNLESLISSTGTLTPITTVEIGTQVSGTIDTVYVDFNDQIIAGQVLAVLDTTLLKASVVEAEASLTRAEAALEESEYNYNLNKRLFDSGLISEADLFPFQIAIKTQTASVKSAQASMQRAEKNLDYAIIRSPISGTVISRDVESGQTVAASLSTPTLFNVAEDLSRMEILVDVDESDIGMIKKDQKARFEVQAYDDAEFEGTVRQVRLQPTTSSNVVTYTVVVEAANKDNLLLPGMTATVDFIIEEKNDILLVSNKALRFTPDNETMQESFEKMREERLNGRDTTKAERFEKADRQPRGNGQMFAGAPGGANGEPPEDAGSVWLIDSGGEIKRAPLRTGMTDGINTEIVMSPVLEEGIEVIIGKNAGDDDDESSSSKKSGGFGGRPPRF